MSELKRTGEGTRGRRRLKIAAAVAGSTFVLLAAAAVAWVISLGPVPLDAAREISTTIVDRNGKLLRAYAMDDGRWRLPVTANEVDPTYLNVLLAFEDKRFRQHHGVDPLALGARRLAVRNARPDRLRRLDHHHAGRPVDRTAARPVGHGKTSADRPCRPARASAVEGRDPEPLPDAGAVRRQSRRAARGVHRLFRQGAEAAVAG